MRISWIAITLWIFLFAFGILYVIGTFFGNINCVEIEIIKLSTDLWANLFASMIAVVIIERVITRARLEKNQQSISLIRVRVTNTITNLVSSVRVPAEWRKSIDNPKYNWDNYHKKLRESRDITLDELESIVDNYSYLINPRLTNDIISLISVLGEYYDYHLKSPLRGYYNLVDAGMFSGLFISESMKILEKHKLLKQDVPDIVFRKGESPKIFWRSHWMNEQQVFDSYLQWLKETILFRDESRERYRQEGQSNIS